MSFLNRLTSEGSERLTEDLRALGFPNVFPVSDPGPALNTLLLSGGLSDTLDDIVSGLDRLYAQVQGQLLSSPDAPSPSVRYALSSQGICEALFFAWEVLSVAASAACLLKRFSDSPCTAWARRGTSACTNAGGPMQAYSMDLRERALLDSDAGMKAADVAVKYRVSGSWVRLLKQRRRETGEVAPRVQRHGRRRMLEPHLHTLAALIAEQPDRTVAELKDALGTPASLATIWRAVAALDVTVKKNGPALRTRST